MRKEERLGTFDGDSIARRCLMHILHTVPVRASLFRHESKKRLKQKIGSDCDVIVVLAVYDVVSETLSR